ncbi:MAG: proliferating cell nuclear antigen (pcna) [Candidatus Woesearchaeota archaeon]
MKLTLESGGFFKDTLNIISDLVSEVRFKITDDGIDLVAMDPGVISMVVLKILPTSFKEFEVEDDEEYVGVNLIDLTKILKRMRSDDEVTLITEENKLLISFKGKSQRKFYIPLLDLSDQEKNLPDFEFSASFETESSRLSDAIADAKVVSDSVILKVDTDKKLHLEAKDNLSKVEEKFEDIEIDSDGEEIKSKYSIDYLEKMITNKLSDKITVKTSDNYPIELGYKVVDKLSLNFILAPRMDTE